MDTLQMNEARALWMAGQELAAARRAGDAETARLVRMEIAGIGLHTDFGRHRAKALSLLDDPQDAGDGAPCGAVNLADWRGR
jgi:hypothetical protein